MSEERGGTKIGIAIVAILIVILACVYLALGFSE
jgi:hypothetical protein